MPEPKMGQKSAIENVAKRFEKLYRQPVSKRISDFLKEEGKKDNRPTSEFRRLGPLMPIIEAGKISSWFKKIKCLRN